MSIYTYRDLCTVYLVTSLSCLLCFFMLNFFVKRKFVGVYLATTRNLLKHQFPWNGYGPVVVTKKLYPKAKYKTCYDFTARERVTSSVRIVIKLVKST